MKQAFYNDQAHIAEDFQINENYTNQRARLASFKINSYKLSLVNTAFCTSREELTGIIKGTLLNYQDPLTILSGLGFFADTVDN